MKKLIDLLEEDKKECLTKEEILNIFVKTSLFELSLREKKKLMSLPISTFLTKLIEMVEDKGYNLGREDAEEYD